MANTLFKIVLRGEIAEGFDADEAKEKLANIFDKNVQQIEKMLSKQATLKDNLEEVTARRYQRGLEKIGILCDVVSNSQYPPKKTKSSSANVSTNLKIVPDTLIIDGSTLLVADIKMPFSSMVRFTFKWLLASIPALILLIALIWMGKMVISSGVLNGLLP